MTTKSQRTRSIITTKSRAKSNDAQRRATPIPKASRATLKEKPKKSKGGVSGLQTVRLIRLLEMRGIDAAAVCRDIGVSIEEVSSPIARVPYDTNDALVEACAKIVASQGQDLSVVLAGVRDAETYDAAGLVLLTSPTLKEGLERAFGYQRLWGDGDRFTLFDLDDDWGVRFRHPGKSAIARSILSELALIEMVSAAQVLVNPEAKAKRLSFVHAPISNVTTLEAIFGVTPIFNSKHNEIIFDRSLGEGAITIPPVVLRPLLEKNAERALAKIPQQESIPLATRIRAICNEDPTTFNLSVSEISSRLHMSSRTLQRQLQDEETSWAALVDQMRKDLASDLKKRGATEKEITYLLGFSDRSSLLRARARWK